MDIKTCSTILCTIGQYSVHAAVPISELCMYRKIFPEHNLKGLAIFNIYFPNISCIENLDL